MIDRLLRLFKTTKPEDTPLADPLEARRAAFRKGVREALDKAHTVAQQTGKPTRASFPLQPYVPPKGVVPEALASGLAMDVSWKNLAEDSIGSFYGSHGMTASVLDGMGFPGFPYLTELTQLTEYRDMSERTAAEMTRKWIKLRSTGDDDKTDIIEKIDAAMRRYHIRELFRQAAVLDGFMGRSQIYIDMMEADNEELQTPLMLNIYKVRKDSLKGFKIVEPITTAMAEKRPRRRGSRSPH